PRRRSARSGATPTPASGSSPRRCRSRTRPSSRTTVPPRKLRGAVPDDRLSRYAELVLRVGCNLQPGQELFLEGKVEHVEFVRKLTESAYRLGATYVHAHYTDEHGRHAPIEPAPAE